MLTSTISEVIDRALAEDSPWGDATGEAFIDVDAIATATLNAREPGVLAGIDVFAAAFRAVDAETIVTAHSADGGRFDAGDSLATLTGNARAVLRAERIALNLVQRLSGIATLTARYVAEVEGTDARVVDTRKTTPGLRALERYAVRCGGGHNHRHSLSDAVMVKDNHLAVAASRGQNVTEALLAARARLPHTTHIEVEVDRIDQIGAVLAAGIDTIMLDNFTPEQLREGIALIDGRALVEASGGITLDTIGPIARTGVDIISVGALTHGVRSLDLGLDIGVDQESGHRDDVSAPARTVGQG